MALQDARGNTKPHTVMILVGNKSVLDEERQISYEEAENFADENNLLFVECSVLNGDRVEQAFLSTAHTIHEKMLCGILNPTDPDSGVQLQSVTLPGTTTAARGRKSRVKMSVDAKCSAVFANVAWGV